MKFTLLFLLAFLFVACSDDTKKAQSIDTEQNVSIEQSDEKTEVNDTNVPLPVSEPTTLLKIQNLHLNLFRQGGGGGKIMSQYYDFFVAIHLYSIYATGFLMVFYLFLTQSNFRTEFDFIRRIRLFLPLFNFFLATVLFTGCLLLALKAWQMGFSIKYMIFVWVAILALSLFQYKVFKKARKIKRYKTFRASSFFILLVELLLLFSPFIK